MKLGIIAEDESDVAVIKNITRNMITPKTMGFKRFIGKGCGKIKRKCATWARLLVRQGCSWIVLIHDLDINQEASLRAFLEKAIEDTGAVSTVVLIPVREIESWLLFDGRAIALAFRSTKTPILPGNPESLQDPKKELERLVRKLYHKEYLNTIHNEKIASTIRASLLGKARSFQPYPRFIKAIKAQLL